MYQPAHFREENPEELHAFLRAHPLGLLITSGSRGIEANLIPFLLDDSSAPGTLLAHLALANPQVEALREGSEVLVTFQGPDAYVSPSWYAAKAEHGRVVPTWNYQMVQVRGIPRVWDDPEWLRNQVEQLTRSQEDTRPHPWQVADAPAPFIDGQLKAIVGIEIPIRTITGKWKLSQNRSETDRAGVAEGLRADGRDSIADLVENRRHATETDTIKR